VPRSLQRSGGALYTSSSASATTQGREGEARAADHDLPAQADRRRAQPGADAREQHRLGVEDRVGDRLRRAGVGEHLPLDRVDPRRRTSR
jgi:hypothetical protein